MRRLSGVLFLASLGLAGCGDDGNDTSNASNQTSTTGIPPATATEPSTDTDTSGVPTSSEGTASATDSSAVPTTTDPGTGSTEPVVTTDAPTTGPTTETTTTTNTTTTTTMSSMSSTTDTPCQELSVTVQPVKPNTMLVLDKSGSMLQKWDDDADPATEPVTRWYSLYAVVDEVLTGFNDKFNFGMSLFPAKNAVAAYDATACVVNASADVPVAEFNKNAILNALPAQNNTTIAGGTPTAAGVTAALNHLKGLDPAVPRIVMLVTDGAANCRADAADDYQMFESYDDHLHQLVGDAYTNDGIPTYVIGIAIDNAPNSNVQDGNPNGINPYVKLNELAALGGTDKPGDEKFYSAKNAIELSDALNAIASAAQSCVVPLSDAPVFPEETVVKLGNVVVPKISDCATESGWKYVEPAPYQAIELCGTACTELKLEGEADVEYFCEAG